MSEWVGRTGGVTERESDSCIKQVMFGFNIVECVHTWIHASVFFTESDHFFHIMLG